MDGSFFKILWISRIFLCLVLVWTRSSLLSFPSASLKNSEDAVYKYAEDPLQALDSTKAGMEQGLIKSDPLVLDHMWCRLLIAI